MCKNLKNELRGYKYNDQIFRDKIEKLKENGIDITQILSEYEKQQESNSETEALLSGRLANSMKPRTIPDLNFGKLSSNVADSSNNVDSEY